MKAVNDRYLFLQPRSWLLFNEAFFLTKVCQENYLSVANLELIFFLRVLLVGELRAAGYIKTRGSCDIRNLNIHAESWPAIKAALTAGLYPNLARYSPIDGNITTHHQTPSQFHFASTLLVQEGRSNESVTSYSASHSYNLVRTELFIKYCAIKLTLFVHVGYPETIRKTS